MPLNELAGNDIMGRCRGAAHSRVSERVCQHFEGRVREPTSRLHGIHPHLTIQHGQAHRFASNGCIRGVLVERSDGRCSMQGRAKPCGIKGVFQAFHEDPPEVFQHPISTMQDEPCRKNLDSIGGCAAFFVAMLGSSLQAHNGTGGCLDLLVGWAIQVLLATLLASLTVGERDLLHFRASHRPHAGGVLDDLRISTPC